MNKVNAILNVIIGIVIGVFIGVARGEFHEHELYAEYQAANSAPWYTDIIICGVISVVILAVLIAVKMIANKKK